MSWPSEVLSFEGSGLFFKALSIQLSYPAYPCRHSSTLPCVEVQGGLPGEPADTEALACTFLAAISLGLQQCEVF